MKYFKIINPKTLANSVRNIITDDMVFEVKKTRNETIEFEIDGYTQIIKKEHILGISEYCPVVKNIYK